MHDSLKFIYSEKSTKFCEIFILLSSYVVQVKSKVKILQNFVTFSKYMNLKQRHTQISKSENCHNPFDIFDTKIGFV